MMNLNECYNHFKELKEISSYINGGLQDVELAIYEKIYWALSHKLFKSSLADSQGKDNRVYPCYLRFDGMVYESDKSENDIVDTGEYIVKSRLKSSDLLNTLYYYYKNSPYWYVFTREATIEDFEICDMDEKDKADSVYLTSELFYDEKTGECIYEYGCLDKFRELGNAPADYFYADAEDGCNISDDCMVLKSYLLPHYFKLDKIVVNKEHECFKRMVEEGIQMLKEMFHGIFILEPDLKASYFTFFDGSSDACYIYPVSIGDVNKAVMLAGTLIDLAIFKLDEYYDILPASLKQGGDICE